MVQERTRPAPPPLVHFLLGLRAAVLRLVFQLKSYATPEPVVGGKAIRDDNTCHAAGVYHFEFEMTFNKVAFYSSVAHIVITHGI